MRRLRSIGVEWVDIGGAGGTSWAAMERARSSDPSLADLFREWGISTCRVLEALAGIERMQIIASGGLRSGIDLAKALSLGARLGGAALPFLRVWHEQGTDGVILTLKLWHETLRRVMFLTGSRCIRDLSREDILIRRQ